MRTIEGDDDSYDEINKNWMRKEWLNNVGNRHRDGDLPAVIYANGAMFFFKDGYYHRDGDLPAVIRADVSEAYYKKNKRHRDGGLPAVIRADGSEEYWVDGMKQR